MIIYYTEDFKRVLNDSLQYIKLSKFKLSTVEYIIPEKEEITENDIKQLIYSPTVGYYEAEGIMSDSLLSLSIEIPQSDKSIDSYRVIFMYYENLLSPTEPNKLAFIISDSMIRGEGEFYKQINFGKLNLEPNRTIINIFDFNPSCHIDLKTNSDIEFLEGEGFGVIGNLLTRLSNEESRYVSRESYEAYLLNQRGTDNYNHYHTSYINNYGFKIY